MKIAKVPFMVGPTALSATTEVHIGGVDLDIPADAKTILAIIPVLSSPAGNTANESVSAKVHIESKDLKRHPIAPYEVLCQPIGSSLLKAVAAVQGDIMKVAYPINCPCEGGEKLKIYGTGLFDHTIEPYVEAAVIFTDQRVDPLKFPQYWSELAAFTNLGAASGLSAAASITINGARKIHEIFGFNVGTTVAALKGIIGKLMISSTDFIPAWNPEIPLNPISGQVDTNIQEAVAGVTRFPIELGVKSRAIISGKFDLGVAITTAGKFVYGVRYS